MCSTATVRTLVLVLGIPLVLESPASAQVQRDWYVSAGVITPRLSGRPDSRSGKSPIELPGGWTEGWSVSVGYKRTPRISIEGEFSQTGEIQDVYTVRVFRPGQATGGGFGGLLETRQDRMIGVRFRVHTTKYPFRYEPFFGGGWIQYRCWERRFEMTFEPPVLPERTPCGNGAGVFMTAGVAAAITVKRVILVPSVAAAILGMNGKMTDRYTSDAQPRTPWSLTPAIHARVEF